ncbi:hypothetical protein JCM17823_11800 [Halorubrum gandharaense]
MSAYETSTDRGFLLSSRDWKVVGSAAALMTLNVVVMAAFAATPLSVVNDYLFAAPIIGVLVYGAAIYVGESVAESGVQSGDVGMAVAGVAILQVAFGLFGAGVLRFVPADAMLAVLGVTAVIVALMTAFIGAYIYGRSGTTFEHYGTWSTYAFLGGLGAILVGTFWDPMLLLGFVFIFAGFLFRLGWELWRVRDGRVQAVSLQAIGLYIAVAGVFVHVLQIVVRMFADR